MDFSQMTASINWLSPVSSSYDGVLRVTENAIVAISTTASAMARQDMLPMTGKPYGVPDKIMALIDWQRARVAELEKTRLVITYDNGDSVRVPLSNLDYDVAIPVLEYDDDLEWREFPYAQKMGWMLDTVTKDKPIHSPVHFIENCMYTSFGPTISRAKRVVMEESYGKFCLPLYAAEYISKLRGTIEIALSGNINWTNNAGEVIGEGPSTIFVRNGDGMLYSAQLFNMAPIPFDQHWSKIDSMVAYKGVVGESLMHYVRLALAIDRDKVKPTFFVKFDGKRLNVSFDDADGSVNGSVPITWEGEYPQYDTYFAVSEWVDRGGELELGFCKNPGTPMVIYYAPGQEVAVMCRVPVKK